MKIVINNNIDKSITDEISSKFKQEWTLGELKEKCKFKDVKYPFQCNKAELPQSIINAHNGMPEKWHTNPERTTYKYEVSNYGRVRWHGEILKQINCEKQGDGWLVLEKYPSVYVYRLVAEYWLQPPTEKDWHVHHIDNDGYNNCIDNLIWVSPDIHKEIHE